MPDAVERTLQLGKHRRGSDEEHGDADGTGDQAPVRLARAAQQRFDRRGPILPDQPRDLRDDLSLCGVATEYRACNGDDDDQQWRHGEDRVVGDRGTHARSEVVDPGITDFWKRPKNSFNVGMKNPLLRGEIEPRVRARCRWSAFAHERCQQLSTAPFVHIVRH